LFSSQKTRLQGDHIVAFQYLKEAYKQEGNQLLTQPGSCRTRRNGFKLKKGKIRLDLRKKFFIQREMRPWHSCPEL